MLGVRDSGLSTIADFSQAMASRAVWRDIATSLGSTSMLPLSQRTAKKKKLSSGFVAEPQLKSNLVQFSLKI